MVERGYRASDTKQAIKSIHFRDKQSILRRKKRNDDTHPVILPVKFNDNCGKIKQTMHKHWHTIQSDKDLKAIFKEKPMIANKKNQSMANMLVRARIKQPITVTEPHLTSRPHHTDPKPSVETQIPNLFPKPTYSMAKCKLRKCSICPKLRMCKTIFNRKCRINFPVPKYKRPLTCQDKYVVYAIKCAECHDTYIGQTVRPLRARIATTFKENNSPHVPPLQQIT